MLQDYAEEWWIDNVFEELDAPNEFWFNASSGQLYLAYALLATILLYYYTATCCSEQACDLPNQAPNCWIRPFAILYILAYIGVYCVAQLDLLMTYVLLLLGAGTTAAAATTPQQPQRRRARSYLLRPILVGLPVRFKPAGRRVLSADLNTETARSERKRPEI
jgi:hypothetical protein